VSMVLTRQILVQNKHLKKELKLKTAELSFKSVLSAQIRSLEVENLALKQQN
jgi:hypothetical protein